MKKGYLYYNENCDRYGIKNAETDEVINDGLHCGECIKIYDPAKEEFKTDRIEYDHTSKQWFFVNSRKAGNLQNIICELE